MHYDKSNIPPYLTSLGIAFEQVEHAPMHTMEDMDASGIMTMGNVCKNLFLRDQKGKNHFLVTLIGNKRADLRYLGEKLGCGKLSFASAERLEKYLGLQPGSVSPLGILNDESRTVRVIFDADLAGEERMGIHPNDNTATLFLSFKTVEELLSQHGNAVERMEFERL